jgi:hypothetical protein
MINDLENKIFDAKADFGALVLDVFRFQYQHNKIYRDYVDTLGIDPESVNSVFDIPFLPIGFFKTHRVVTSDFEPEMIFESSGTTGNVPSRHPVRSLDLYQKSFTRGFERFYGSPRDYCIIGLLPSYLERRHSSLVWMVDHLIQMSGHEKSGFYLNEFENLAHTLQSLEAEGQQTLLIGVTFALLDFAEAFPMPLRHTVVMETGGMKGRREEIIREEVHDRLRAAFGLSAVHSEYGMSELLSQAYSSGGGIFQTPPWMKVLVRDESDPLALIRVPPGGETRGALNIIDLSNIWSCSFLATEDLGIVYGNGSFRVQGRLDASEWRGCSMLTA